MSFVEKTSFHIRQINNKDLLYSTGKNLKDNMCVYVCVRERERDGVFSAIPINKDVTAITDSSHPYVNF